MPIGKNALKRVTNNGYSAVNASAPDMENSEILEAKTETKEEPKVEKKVQPKVEVKKPAAKKPATKKPAAKKAEKPEIEKKVEEVKTEEIKTEEATHPDGFIKVSLGMDMPSYLL